MGDWDDEQFELALASVTLYKQLRGRIKVGKVVHLMPPTTALPNGEGIGWDAIQSVDPQVR